MNVEGCIQQLTDNAERIRVLAHGVSDTQARWKPAVDSWSILEVVNHLYDEEREDFRVRLDIILHHPEDDLPAIDPQGWVTKRNYNERDLEESLHNFLSERRASLDWLRGLSSPAWDTEYKTRFGQIRAGDMFAAWVTHDHLHMRQLVEPYSLDYAGEW